MQSSANIKYLRYSPKKLRELGRAVVGLSSLVAIDRLSFFPQKGGRLLSSAIKSALSNHANNLKQDKTLLKIKSIEILKGPTFKRWQPVSRGMAHQIKKKTVHIKVILEETKPVVRNLPEKLEDSGIAKKNPTKKEERRKSGTKD